MAARTHEKAAQAAQQSEAWFRARLGVLTAGSCFKTIMYGRKDGIRSLVLTKVAERLTGTWQEASSASLEWGKQHEDEALSAYRFRQGVETTEAGLIYHPDSAEIGCSPDALVGEEGGAEVKCPHTSREHVRNLLEGLNWKEYGPQVQGCLWITGREWWDFVSYDPRMPQPARLYVQRYYRDEDYIEELAEKVWAVNEQIRDTVLALMEDNVEALERVEQEGVNAGPE